MEIKRDTFTQVKSIISSAQTRAIQVVDNERVAMYWQIGKLIFEEEQQGKDRAEYGKYLINSISQEFLPQFGTDFSIRQLERYRRFFRRFPIATALRAQSSAIYAIRATIDSRIKKRNREVRPQ